LLHYFASFEKQGETPAGLQDSWCGWHNDHSALTALTSAMYIDKNGKIVDFADEETGLFVKKRNADIMKAPLPKDALGF